MKPRFVNSKAIKSYYNGSNKQVSKEVISSIDNAVHCILSKSLVITRNFKRVTGTEVDLVCASLVK
jgi:hypothetical protein